MSSFERERERKREREREGEREKEVKRERGLLDDYYDNYLTYDYYLTETTTTTLLTTHFPPDASLPSLLLSLTPFLDFHSYPLCLHYSRPRFCLLSPY